MNVREHWYYLYDKLKNDKETISANITIGLLNKKWKRELDRNSELKNKYTGKRCFILGNGPSLNDISFETLKDEYVFTVNQIARHKDFEKLNTNFHFWADENFFRLDPKKPEDVEVLNIMKKTASGNNPPICFYPIEESSFIEQNELYINSKCYYFLSRLRFTDKYNGTIDYTRVTFGFGTVVQWCITMAIYMGFTDIYLLGCDTTGLINNINASAHQIDNSAYSYKVTDNEKKRYVEMMSRYSLIRSVDSYLSTLKDYQNLYIYCTKKNINLINLSSTTAIDTIPRDSLENILNGQK